MKAYRKVILAYSGGLDTSVMLTWLKEQGVKEIVAVAADLGQIPDPVALEKKALATGADKFILADLKREFIDDYVFPTLKAGAKYENVYLLGTATARPLIAKALVKAAQQEKAEAIVHGCTGKGNDQVRFELGIYALDPTIEVVVPWRFWEISSRTEEIAYAEAHGIPISASKDHDYSEDENVWHISHEGMELEKTENEADYAKMLVWAKRPEEAPDQAETVTVSFEQGVPFAVNGKKMGGLELVTFLNELGGKHGVGVDDIVENRLIGMKCRGVYENPAGAILYKAHEKLESITLDRDMLHEKQMLALKYAELVYSGQWFSPLREALAAFVDRSQQTVSGDVTLKLFKGNLIPLTVSSPYSLYNQDFATFEADKVYNQGDSGGFCRLYGLTHRIRALMLREKGELPTL